MKASDRSAWWIALAGVIGAIVGTIITGAFNYMGQKGDIDAKMIELSISILQTAPKPETTPLRDWAINTLQARGNFSFTAGERAALLNNSLPVLVPGGPHGYLVYPSSPSPLPPAH
jgi:hypothetical protein